LISKVGQSSSDAGSPPAGGFNANAVNLHLESGLMGPGNTETDDSSDAASATPAPTPEAPAPPPAWVPPPAPPPPAHLDESSDPFSSRSAWTADDTPKVEVAPATPAPVTPASYDYSSHDSSYSAWSADDKPKETPATPAAVTTASYDSSSSDALRDPFSSYSAWSADAAPKAAPATPASVVTASSDQTSTGTSEYEKLLFGDKPSTPSYSWEKPITEVKAAAPVPTASYTSPFDDAQKLIDASSAKPDAPAATPAWHFDAPSAPAHNAAADDWMHAFDEHAAAPMKAVVEEKVDVAPAAPAAPAQDWSSRWGASAHDDVDNGLKAVMGFDSPITPTQAVAETPVAVASTQGKADEDPIARMRRLFKQNSLMQASLLQKNKKGHMVSIKLYRGK